MATPSIRINQTGQSDGTPGQSRTDCVKSFELQVTDTANVTGPWAWTVITPVDSVAVATGLNTNDVRITPDVEGSYLFYVIRNGTELSYTLDSIGQKISTQGGAAVLLTNGRRIPAAGETTQFNADFGWTEAMEDMLRNDISLEEEDVSVTGGPFNKLNFKATGGGSVLVADAGSGEATVTISGGAGGGGTDLDIQDEGVSVEAATAFIDFTGPNVVATASGTNGVRIEVTDTNTDTLLGVEDEGVSVEPAALFIDFTGAGVTATASGTDGVRVEIPGGGGSDLSVEDEGTEVEAATSFIDFTGAGVTATASGTDGVRVEITGGGGGSDLSVEDEGTEVEAATAFIDFVGAGVTATASGTDGVRIEIPGGGSGGDGPLEFIDVIEVVSDQTSVSFGAAGDGELQHDLNGDTDQEYVISWFNPPNGGSASLTFRPNGITADQATARMAAGSSAPFGSASADLAFWTTGSSRLGSGEFVFKAESGRRRTFTAHALLATIPETTSNIFRDTYAGVWDDTATVVTSIDIVSSLASAIKAGAQFVLWRRRRVPNGGANNLALHDEGTLVSGTVNKIDFAGEGITATTSGTFVRVQVDATGGGSALSLEDEGTEVEATAAFIDFTGAGVTATASGVDGVRIEIPGSSGLPAQGDYLVKSMSGSQSSINVGTTLDFDTVDAQRGDVTSSGNQFVGLRAGRTYLLQCNFRFTTGAWMYFRWYDATASAFIGGDNSPSVVFINAVGTVHTVFTPTVDTTVEVRIEGASGAFDTDGFGLASVTEVGVQALEITDDGVTVSGTVNNIDFAGEGVTATASGNAVRVQIDATGGGSALSVEDEGTEVEATTAFIDFVGAGVTATASGTDGVRVEIPAGVVGALEFMDIIEVGSDTTSVTFGASGDGSYQRALDGDVDEEYVLSFSFPVPGSIVAWDIRPNGVSTNQATGEGYAGPTHGSLSYSALRFATDDDADRYNSGTLVLLAKTGVPRSFHSVSVSGRIPETSTAVWRIDFAGIWDDTTTNITSLDIVATVANTIKIGARFVLWRRVRALTGAANNLMVRDEGTLVSGTVNNIDFAGEGVTATASGNAVRVQIDATGGGSALSIEDEGTEVEATAAFIDFVGAGVTATASGVDGVRVEIAGTDGILTGWQFVETVEVTGAAASVMSFTGLAGDTDEEYLLVFDMIHDSPGTSRDWGIAMNQIFTNQAGSWQVSGNRTARSTKMSFVTTLRDNISGIFHIIADATPGGSLTARPRKAYGNYFVGDDPASANVFDGNFAGMWSDTATELTSLDVTCTPNSTATTAIAEMAIGSTATLYKKAVGGGFAPLEILEEGASVDSATTAIDFVGSGVTATASGTAVRVEITGGGAGSDLSIEDEGTEVEATAAFIDFVGAGVTATASGTDGVRVEIPGSSGLPAQGDYIHGALSGDITIPSTGSPVTFNTALVQRGALDVDTAGKFFTLKAGRTYVVVGSLAIFGGVKAAQYQWYNVTAATDIGSRGAATTTTSSSGFSNVPIAQAIITPTEDTELELRVKGSFGSPTVESTDSYVRIVEMGVQALEVAEEAVTVSGTTTAIDFVGDGVTATASGTYVRVEITGGGGGSDLSIEDEGTEVEATTAFIDFTGAGVTATASGTDGVRVEITGGVVGALEFMDVIEVGVDTTSVSFGASGDGSYLRDLNGDTDEEYVLTYYFPDPLASCSFEFRPNGLTTNQLGARNFEGTASGASAETRLFLQKNTISGLLSAGKAEFHAKTGKQRAWLANTSLMGSASYRDNYAGMWTDTTTILTSIDIVGTVANTIKDGAIFKLWRRLIVPTGAANNLAVRDEGTLVSGTVNNIDFVGPGVTATASGVGGVRVELPGGIVAQTVLSSDATTISLTGLDGDADGEYEITGRVKMATTSAVNIRLAPNGAALTDRPTARGVDGGGTTITQDGLIIAHGGVSAAVEQSFVMRAFVKRGIQARAFKVITTGRYNTTLVARWDSNMVYTDESANLTSLDLVSSVASGFLAGSEMTVRRVY